MAHHDIRKFQEMKKCLLLLCSLHILIRRKQKLFLKVLLNNAINLGCVASNAINVSLSKMWSIQTKDNDGSSLLMMTKSDFKGYHKQGKL